MTRADDWCIGSNSMKSLFGNRVITGETINRDKSMNDLIQEQGARLGANPGNEADWYKKNKGYSKRLQENENARS